MKKMYDWEDQEFYESSQYADEIEALQSAIRSSIREEVLEEMNRLQTENKKLQGIKEHFESVKRDYERKKSECDRIIADAACKARQDRLYELMKDHKVIRFKVSFEFAYGLKCRKCDKNRNIKITLPSGKIANDDCKCKTEGRRFYIPVPYMLYEFTDRNGMRAWYKECAGSYGEAYYTLTDGFTVCDSENSKLLGNLKAKKIEEDEIRRILFDSREECQNICDELNAKQGHQEWVYNMDGTLIMG